MEATDTITEPKPKAKILFKDRQIKDGKRFYKGIWLDKRYSEWQCELACFILCEPGETKLILWKGFVEMMWPEPIFFWDEWSELFYAACCGAGKTIERLTGVAPDPKREWWRNIVFWGAASCVSGDTKIYDPISNTETPIGELYERGKDSWILTKDGPAKASAPFIKGKAQLFQVELSNGRHFKATAAHSVLTKAGYRRVGELNVGESLLGFSDIQPQTNSVYSPSIHHEDEAHCSNKSPDFRGGYPACSCFCDEPLHSIPEDAPNALTSQIDAQEHTDDRHEWHSDVPVCIGERSHPYLGAFPHSTEMISGLFGQQETPDLYLHVQEMLGRAFDPSSLLLQLQSEMRRPSPFAEQARDFLNTHLACDEVDAPTQNFQTNTSCSDFRVHRVTVQSINPCGVENFYDLTVPEHHHYFAEGCFHHNTGKSAKAALWIIGNWIAETQFTMAVLTSTSRDMLSDRIWSDIVLWIGKAQFNQQLSRQLKIVNSELEIRWNDNDRKGMISGEAVKSGGSVEEAVDRLKGKHNRRVFVVIDEMTAVPKAIITAARNLNKGTQEFQMIGMANPRTWVDPCGERSEPLHGRSSISLDSIFWETEFGCVVRFDGLRNPGLKDKRLYFYPTQAQLDEDARESGGVNSPEYYSGVRGFIAPSGLQPTVMDEQLFEQFHVREAAIWKTIPEMGGMLDPAFEGGDRRVLYPIRFGTLATGLSGIEYLAPIIVGIDAKTDVRWIHYAIADKVVEICEGYEHEGKKAPIPPKNFMMDTTGEGGGLFNILSGRWSPDIHPCEFGGAAEKVQVSPDRPTTYFELYANKVTAMWYRMRRYIEGDQVRGLGDSDTLKELASREKALKGGKTQVEPKKDMKKRGLRSPDKADAAVIGAEFMFVNGFVPGGKTGGGSQFDYEAWNKFAAKMEVSENRSYSSDFDV